VISTIIILGILAILLWVLGLEKLGSIRQYTLTTRDLIITVLCSFAPIILASLVQSSFTPINFLDAFTSSFSKGQAFLYTSAFLSAFFILYLKDSKKPPGPILGLVILSGSGGALLYTLFYASATLNLRSYAAEGVVSTLEVIIVCGVLIVWFWSTLPSNKIPNSGANEAQNQQNDLESRFQNLRGTNK
jgi:hypothetical protein